jgi:hypothetical protein
MPENLKPSRKGTMPEWLTSTLKIRIIEDSRTGNSGTRAAFAVADTYCTLHVSFHTRRLSNIFTALSELTTALFYRKIGKIKF